MACVLTHLTLPKPAGTIVHPFTQSSNPALALYAQHWGPQEGVGGELGDKGGRDDFDLDLNSDLESSFLQPDNSDTQQKERRDLGYNVGFE